MPLQVLLRYLTSPRCRHPAPIAVSPPPQLTAMSAFAFIALYLLFDAIAYLDPLYGLNITPWNPDPALGLLFWFRYGRRAALPWLAALLAGDVFVRGMPAGAVVTVLGALWLTAAYGAIGAALRRYAGGELFASSAGLSHWLAIVVAGNVLNALGYVSLLSLVGALPAGQWATGVLRFGIGDTVGMVVSMPLLALLASGAGRARLREAVWRAETPAYLALACCVLWAVFGFIATSEFKHFYFLFLPVIWAASRQGVCGAALIVFVLQLAIVAMLKAGGAPTIAVSELQMLDAMLALVGFFIGIVVDERRQVADELKQSLRVAAAGEMAAALAHELNQPLTALGAYGKACEHLLARGDTGPLLQGAIGRMVAESARAADVVRRLRDFFRTGAMQLETVNADALMDAVARQFQLALHEHGVRLALTAAPDVRVRVDRLQIELVLRNLFDNALDAVRSQPRAQRRITLAAARLDGDLLCITVEDSGGGMSEAVAARLFEPFVSSKASGMGLGLVLSRAIVEAHGGSLRAEAATRGVFRLVLPALAHGTAGDDER